MMRVTMLATGFVAAMCCVVNAQNIELVAGGGTGGSGSAAKAFKFHSPFGLDFRGDSAFIVELEGGRAHRWDMRAGTVRIIGGQAEKKGYAGDGMPVGESVFNGMHSVVVQRGTGDVYIADTWNARVRKIDAKTGVISTVAGTGDKKFTGDGPAVSAGIGDIYAIAFDAQGRKLYMTSLPTGRILVLDTAAGTVTSVAGNGKKGRPEEGGVARQQPLVDPRAAAVDSKGNLYILERGGHALRVVDGSGKIRTVVNASGKKGATGDGGAAIEATMNGPKHLCIDGDDSVIIADAENHLIRRYDPKTGKITRLAGTGRKGTAGVGGEPTQCELARPHGVTVAADGSLYICDTYNDRILRIAR